MISLPAFYERLCLPYNTLHQAYFEGESAELIRSGWEKLRTGVVHTPLIIWVLAAYLMVYGICEIWYYYISPDYEASPFIFTNDAPALDLKQVLGFSHEWAIMGGTPYDDPRVDNLFPPFVALFFSPLLIFSYNIAGDIVVGVDFILFIVLTVGGSMLIDKKHQISLLTLLLFFTGLTSHGFRAEIERAQFNLITYLCCWAGIYLFHHKPKLRLLAYLLFIISVQLKVFPLIFIVMFVSDWRAWKENILRFIGLGIANFAFLFILGTKSFFAFIEQNRVDWFRPWVLDQNNHAINSFVYLHLNNSQLWLFALEAIFAACFLIILWRAYQANQQGINPYLFLGCVIGTLLLAPTSVDYKLSGLVPAMAIFFAFLDLDGTEKLPTHQLALLFLLMLFYSLTLFRPSIKMGPDWLRNNYLPIQAMMFVLVIIDFAFSSRVRNSLAAGNTAHNT